MSSLWVALGFLLMAPGERSAFGQSGRFSLTFTNAANPILPGQGEWLDPMATITTSGAVNWSNAVLELAFLTNGDLTHDHLTVWPGQTNLQVQSDQLVFSGVVVGAVLPGTPPVKIRFNESATTDAVTAALRAMAFTNSSPPSTLDALATPQPVRGLRVRLTDGNGKLQELGLTLPILYLIDIRFDPAGVFITQTDGGETVLQGAWNTDPLNFFTLTGYPLDARFLLSCGQLSFDPVTAILHVAAATDPVSSPTRCVDFLGAGPLEEQLTVTAFPEDPCVVDVLEWISSTDNILANRRSPRQTATTALVSAANFRALEALMNQTAEGRRLANLYRQNTAELLGIMFTNPPLLQATLKLVQAFQPGVASLLAGDGGSFSISAALVSQVQVLAAQFANLGSTNLRAVIQAEKTRLNNFTGFISQDFNHWAGTLGVSIPTNAMVEINRVQHTNGQFSVQANGIEGFSYSLWRTSELTGSGWEQVTNVLLAWNGLTLELTDPARLDSRAYYRVGAQTIPPVVLNQPYPANVTEGANAYLSISATGFHPEYQWQFNGQDIPSATGASLSLIHVSRCQAGLYTVRVSNNGGVITSLPALLSVLPQTFDLVTNGLLAHLPFDSDYRDVSGHGYGAAPEGAPVFTAGEIGSGALRFSTLQNGSSFNYVTLGTNVVKQIATNDFSVAFWINLTNTGLDVPLVANMDWRGATNVGFALIAVRFGSLLFSIIDGAGGSAFVGGGLITDGAWHHVAVTCQRRGLAQVYIDGLPTQAASLVGLRGSIDSGLPVNVGQDGRGSFLGPATTGTTSGVLDDLGIWQRSLSANEVASLYFEGQDGLTFDNLPARPIIFAQPCSQAVTEGLNAAFTVIALGNDLNYQWQWRGSDLPSATNASLSVTNVQSSQAGPYKVVISNAFGSITSNPAMLAVNARPFYVLTNGLVAHLPFDGGYNDVSGGRFDGVPIGTPGLVAGKVGSGALRFSTFQDGSSFNYLTLGTNIVKQIATNDFTLAFWINVPNFAGNLPLLANEDWASPDSIGFSIALEPGGILSGNVGIGVGLPLNVTGSVVADGTWHHVAMTYERGRLSVLYEDGQPAATTVLSLLGSIDAGLPLNIGQDGRGNDAGHGTAGVTNGLLDDLGIWRRILSPREVEFIYLEGRDGLTFDVPR